MKRKKAVQNSWLYQHRYWFVAIIIALLALFMAAYRFWTIPYGLSIQEKQSAIASSQLINDPGSILPTGQADGLVNLPWRLLQGCSIKLLGMSVFSVRLPAVIAALLAVVVIIFLLSKIFRPNLAAMSGLLLVSSSFAIALSRSGTPVALITLLVSLALLAGYYIANGSDKARRRGFWCAAIVCGLLTYMTGGIYLVIALVAAAIVHPRIRLVLKSNKAHSIAYCVLYLVLTLPLSSAVVADLIGASGNDTLKRLLAIGRPSLSNLGEFAAAYAGLHGQVVGGLIVPMTSIVGGILTLGGLVYCAMHARASVRFYLLIAMLVVLFTTGACNPGLIYLLFIPVAILQTMCIAWITNSWYGLFPKNPYARVFAVVPIAILIGSLCLVDANRYFNSAGYDSDVVYSFDQKTPVAIDFIKDNKDKSLLLIADNSTDREFYRQLALSYDNVGVAEATVDEQESLKQSLNDFVDDQSDQTLVVVSNNQVQMPDALQLVELRTGWTAHDDVALRVYQRRS